MTDSDHGADGRAAPVRLGMTAADRRWVYGLFGGGGMLLLLAVPWLADLVRDLEFIPFRSVIHWLADLTQWWAWLARPLLGLVAGLIVAVVILADETVVLVGDDGIRITRGSDTRVLAREQIVGARLERKKLIIDGTHGRTLLDRQVEAPAGRIAEAFRHRDYPWEGGSDRH